MEKILIKCSSCGQKFSVSESYKNRVVECGSCDHRFKVEETSIVSQKKKRYYPGEKSKVNSTSFAKAETGPDGELIKNIANNQLGVQPTQHQKNVDSSYAHPRSAKRTFAILAGASIIILFIIIFLLGGRPDGIFQDIDQQKRILLAGFIAVLGCGLIIWGNRHKLKGMLLALVLGGSLVALPFFIPVLKTPEFAADSDISNDENPVIKTDTDDEAKKKMEQYKIDIGFRKVASIRSNTSEPNNIKAVVVRNIGSHTDTIGKYFQDKLNLEFVPTDYKRESSLNQRKISLFVIKSDISTADLLELTKKFGTPAEMNEIRTELDVVEVLVDEDKLSNTSTDLLTDESNPNFFYANYKELYHISRDRQVTAVQRLEKIKTSFSKRADIVKRLAQIISEDDPQLSNEAIRALRVWALPEYNIDSKVKSYAAALADKSELELPVMQYLVENKVPDISDILSKQWLRSNGHLIWDDLMKKAGAEGETAIIKSLPKADSSHLKAASTLLLKIGTEKSLPALNAALPRADKEDAKYLKATIDEIKSRR